MPKVGVAALRCARRALRRYAPPRPDELRSGSGIRRIGRILGAPIRSRLVVLRADAALFDSHWKHNFPRATIGENYAEGGSRTHNLVRGLVFETDAYASSATSARRRMDLAGIEPAASSMPLRRSTR